MDRRRQLNECKQGVIYEKVLFVEDEASIRSFIVINLRRGGYDVIEAESGEEALELLRENPDTKVALLDIMLPGIDGFEVCRRIRAINTRIGIIMLTARSQEMDKVTGLMTGADDYVTKPFSPAELTARVDALYRRAGGEDPVQTGELRQPPFLLNTRNRTLEKNGQRIKLTQVEYSIMRVFMENPGKALSREEILDMVWGRDYFGELKIVDVNIRRLRLKIEDDAQNPIYITTIWGFSLRVYSNMTSSGMPSLTIPVKRAAAIEPSFIASRSLEVNRFISSSASFCILLVASISASS